MATLAGERPLARTRGRSLLAAAREAPLAAVVILGGLALVALLADVIAPHDPTLPVAGGGVFDPPFWMEGGRVTTLLGTDFQGRDILSRLLHGSRVSLTVARVVIERLTQGQQNFTQANGRRFARQTISPRPAQLHGQQAATTPIFRPERALPASGRKRPVLSLEG